MIILPAIDIYNGKCVRLRKGDYNTVSEVSDSPIDTALKFVNDGAEWIHIVDLNGAKDGTAVNIALISDIIKKTNAKIEVGGGIRALETIDRYINAGAERVILGSAAVENVEFLKKAAAEHPGKIAVGIDALNGMVMIKGWTEPTTKTVIQAVAEMEQCGVCSIIYTQIENDGMLSGINADAYRELADMTSIPIIASGGVKDIDDIKRLKKTRVWGVICGKSIYEGTLDLKSAIDKAVK